MAEYRVELRADVYAEWVGEADSVEHAERLALDCTDLDYEVDFMPTGVWGPDDD